MLLMQNDDPVAGGGLPVIHITQAQYDANPSAYNDPNVLVHITNATGGNLQGSDVSYDSTLKFNNIGDIATKAIAKVEPSDTALYAHAVGTYFINKDGEYCVTDSAIAVNGTITKGTNCHVVTVADELSSINSNLSSLSEKTQVYYIEPNGSVTIQVKSSARYVMYCLGANRDNFGLYLINVASNGGLSYQPVLAFSTGITMTATINSFTLNNTTTYWTNVVLCSLAR